MVMNLLMIAQVVTALGVIVLVLMQHGKGADMGAAFGSGSSGSLFGATGSANFLSRTTAVLATLFFIFTLVLALLVNKRPEAPASVMHGVTQPVPAPAPAPAQAPPSDVPSAGAGATPSRAPAPATGGAGTGVRANDAPANDVPR